MRMDTVIGYRRAMAMNLLRRVVRDLTLEKNSIVMFFIRCLTMKSNEEEGKGA